MAWGSAREAEGVPGLRREALERRGLHLRTRPQDEPIHSDRGIRVLEGLVRDVEAGWRDADLELAEFGRPRGLPRRLPQGGHALARLLHVQPEAVPAMPLRHGAAIGRWRPAT